MTLFSLEPRFNASKLLFEPLKRSEASLTLVPLAQPYNKDIMTNSLMPFYTNKTLAQPDLKMEETATEVKYTFDADPSSKVHVTVTNKGLVTLKYSKQASDEKFDKGYYAKTYQSNAVSRQFFLKSGCNYENTKVSRVGNKLTLIVPKKCK